MSKTMNEIVSEQFGGLLLMLCQKDALVAQLQEENKALKDMLPKDKEIKENK